MIVDTSFLIAFFLNEDELHEKAINNFKNVNGHLIIPDRVLEETFTVLCYKKGVVYSLEVINKLKNNKDIIIYKIDYKESELIFEFVADIKKKFSFVDYIILYLALNTHEKLLCFDDELVKIVKNLSMD